MKTPLILALVVGAALPLAACESSSTARNSDASDYRLVSAPTNGTYQAYAVPDNNASATPYTLRGDSQPANPPAADLGTPRQGTNGW
jgi:hypothetical protein